MLLWTILDINYLFAVVVILWFGEYSSENTL